MGGTVSKEADAVGGDPRWVGARSRGASSRVRSAGLPWRWDFGMGLVLLDFRTYSTAPTVKASVRGTASKLSSPLEPVIYGLVQFKCCVHVD